MTTTTREALEAVVARLAEIINQLPDEVPDRVEVWPEDDEHLRGDFWEDKDGDVWAYRDERWYWKSPGKNPWWPTTATYLRHHLPLTRTTDPSQPRKFDSLDDVPDNVERVKGTVATMTVQCGRSNLPASGWMSARVQPNEQLSPWYELPDHHLHHVTDIEEVIGHE